MNTDEFVEGQNLTVEFVKNSPIRKCVVLDEAVVEEFEVRNQTMNKLCCNVEIGKKHKKWIMNKDSISNMRDLSKDSKDWIGQVVSLSVAKLGGFECVVGFPVNFQSPLINNLLRDEAGDTSTTSFPKEVGDSGKENT